MWKRVTMHEYAKRISGTPEDGPSPGGAAHELGISRQAVHYAIERGDLDAYRITKEGRLVAVVVCQCTLDTFTPKADSRRA